MAETFQLSLKYVGKDVADGSMSIADMINAMDGLYGAYSKIAAYKGASTCHDLRVTALQKGSVNIIFQVIEFVSRNQDQLELASKSVASVSGIIATVLKVIEIIKHGKGKPLSTKVNGDGNLIIQNCENVSIVMPKQIYEIHQRGVIKMDLGKLVDPLHKEKIDSAKITADHGREHLEGLIGVNEKGYFSVDQEEATKTEEMVLVGELTSLNKDRKGGSFYLEDRTRIPYRIVARHPQALYREFIHQGLVKVHCVAHLDKNLKPTLIEIHSIIPIQGELHSNE